MVTLSLFFIIVSAGAMPGDGGIKLRVSAEQANIREKPDIASVILQQLPEGAILEAERKEGEWYAVLVEKEGGGFLLGYVHESLVMVIEPAPPVPSPQRKPPEKQEPAVAEPVEVKEEPRPLPPQAPPAPEEMGRREKIGLVFWIGGRRAEVGDLNDGARGLARYYEARLSAVADGEIKEVHFGYLFGAEVRVPVAPGFYLSFGAERASAEASSSILYRGGSSNATYTTKPAIKLTPISLAVIIYPLRFIYAKAGLDFTFARCNYFYRLSSPGQNAQAELWQEWKGEATSSGFGYQFGLGVEWPIASFVSLITEVAYRYSRLGGFEGEDFYQESSEYQAREEGTLYRIKASAGGPETYPLVFVRTKEPTDAGIVDVRKAQLDLSGYTLKLGLSVRF